MLNRMNEMNVQCYGLGICVANGNACYENVFENEFAFKSNRFLCEWMYPFGLE